ncbi:MAG: phospholipase D-like domain-containing protein [Myxococcales bacterium]
MRHHAHTSTSAAGSQAIRSLRQLAEQALSRTSGAPLVDHNRVRLLCDATENYPAMLEAIRSARKFVHLENYIFDEDEVGREFADALIDRARAGVVVRVIRDWWGTWRGSSRSFWKRMGAAGVHIRCFNPPRLDSPVSWVTRDHRKMLAVDGRAAFVMGLCISKRWNGNPAAEIPPWRDTGVEITGPAVAEVHAAFGQTWEAMGDALPRDELPNAESIAPQGSVALRVVAGAPATAGMFRTDQLIAAVARETLWLTDAYFVGVTPYVQALLAAARDGVDVRLLIPNATDLVLVRALSRSGYRPLLEGGIRIFEWNGSMLHAKTAVVDGRWSRIGSSNLNIASFVGNYELDVAIDDVGVAQQMQQMYLKDLDGSTEIVLSRNRVRKVNAGPRTGGRRQAAAASSFRDVGRGPGRQQTGTGRKGSAAAAGAIRVANVVGAAMTNHRVLGPAEGGLVLVSGAGLVALAVLASLWPRVAAVPLSLIAAWSGMALLWRAVKLKGRSPPTAGHVVRRRKGSRSTSAAAAGRARPATPASGTVAETAPVAAAEADVTAARTDIR